jgi:putative transposase
MAGMSGSVLRYQRRDDGNQGLRGRIVDLAHRHRRYGYKMIHLRLRHEGWTVTSLANARSLIEAWRRDYNEQRPKKNLGGLPPAIYAAKLAAMAPTSTRVDSHF